MPKSLLNRLANGAIGLAWGSVAIVAWGAAAYPLLGKAAPDFALASLNGPNVRLSEHRGEVVVLTFWGSGCGSCANQLTALGRSLATYRSTGLAVYGVSIDDNPAHARQYAGEQRQDFPLLLDPAKEVGRAYRIDNLPMTVLIDRGGTVRYVHRDFSAKGDALYLTELRELLNE